MAKEYLNILDMSLQAYRHHIRRLSKEKSLNRFERLLDIAFSFKGARFMNLLGIESGNVRMAYVTKETLRGQLQYFLRCERGWAWLTLWQPVVKCSTLPCARALDLSIFVCTHTASLTVIPYEYGHVTQPQSEGCWLLSCVSLFR